MEKLISDDQFEISKPKDLIPLKCKECQETFYKKKSYILTGLKKKGRPRTFDYCSSACNKSRKLGKLMPCEICSKETYKNLYLLEKRKHHFCSLDCYYNYPKEKKPLVSKKCINCQKEYMVKQDEDKKYCSSDCRRIFNRKQKIKEWKSKKLQGCKGKALAIKPFIRDYLFEKYNNKCCKCGWSEINEVTGRIPLEVNHIDGNPINSFEDNLELICPNCHSLTPNFRALNTNSPRQRN